jgi:concanavalin A-like lectin/glucanase superfamily protein/galactose oxidase-like protein/Kelch motif protein
MKKRHLSRRHVLGGMLYSPVVSLVGCGPNGVPPAPSSSPEVLNDPRLLTLESTALNPPGAAIPATGSTTTAGQVKPSLACFEYSADADEPEGTRDDLPSRRHNVSLAADRFAQGALCYEFNGVDSSVHVDTLALFPQDDFAILLWVRTSSRQPMELLRFVGGVDWSLVLSVTDAAVVLSVNWTGSPPATVATGVGFATLADGAWHHLAIQRYQGQLQIFVDGISRGLFSWSGRLPHVRLAQIGGSWEGAIDTVRIYNRAFPLSSIPQSVYAWTPVKVNTASATENLIDYYPFEDGTANDYLNSDSIAVLDNVTPTADRFGSSKAAFLFNGTDSSITLTPDIDSVETDFAIGFWELSSAPVRMIGLSVTSGGVEGTSLDFVFNGGSAIEVDLDGIAIPTFSVGLNGALTDGRWHFVLLQRAGTELQLYIDGLLAAATENSSIFFGSASVLRLGCGSGANTVTTNCYWNGVLDDLQLYEISLTAQQITSVQGLAFLGRDGAGGLSFNGRMWLLGGWNPNCAQDTNNEVWSSEDGVNWRLDIVAPWERRHDAGYAVLNDKMWIVGGDNNTGHYQNDVWCSADGVNWEQVTDNVLWANRATHYVLVFNDRLWLMGGQEIFESSTPVVAYNDVWSSADGANWQLETPAAAWSPRGLILGNVVFRGRMWVIGGGQYDVRTFNNDVWSSADGINWKLILEQAPWSPRQFHSITVFDNKIWVLAGGTAENQGGLNDVWYSTDGEQWTQLAAAPWIARHAATAITHNNFLWLIGGSDQYCDNDVWKMGYAP